MSETAARDSNGFREGEGAVTRLEMISQGLHATQTWFSHLYIISRRSGGSATWNIQSQVAHMSDAPDRDP